MHRGFLRNTAVVGSLTFLSRVTGVLRDMVYLIMFGAGPLMDAFLVAYKIPNFLRRLTAEGAFSQAFVPVISEYRVRREHAEVRGLVAGVAGVFGTVLLVTAVLGAIGAPVLAFLFAPGFREDGGRFDLTVEMLRFTFPYLFFISLVALGSGVLNSYGRFGMPAFNQVLLNLVMIVAAAFVAPYFAQPHLVLAIGVFVAGFVQLLALFPAMHRLGLLPRPRFDRAHEGVRRIARLMLPGIFGSSVAQVSLLLDTIIASFLMVGSVTWLYSADRLVEFPMGVFSIALATVILPGNVQDADKSRLAAFHEDIEAAPFAKDLANKTDPTFKVQVDKVRIPAQSLAFPLTLTFQPAVKDPKAKGGKAPAPAAPAAPAPAKK